MKDRQYYSVSFVERNTLKIRELRYRCGGLVAYGRWECLKQILGELGGAIRLDDSIHLSMLIKELDFENGNDLTEYLNNLAELDLIDSGSYGRGTIISREIVETLEHHENSRKGGLKSAKARASAKAKTEKKTVDKNPSMNEP